MLTLNMLGHVYVTHQGQSVQVSNKGAALLSYLALEKQSHHREHLADLLWDHPQSLRNLRVELTRLKQQGISPFPARQPMLSLNCTTDLEHWLHSSADISERNLPDWLARMRGFPLSGLEDVGSPSFRHWVEQQRWSISDSLERTLAQVYSKFMQRGHLHALELIREHAERLSLTLPQTPPPQVSDQALFRYWSRENELRRIGEGALSEGSSRVIYLNGPAGTHRSMITHTFQGSPWRVMHVHLTDQRRFVQAALTQNLANLLPEVKGEFLELLRDATEAGELDLIRMSALVARTGQPVVIAVQVEQAQPWFLNAVRFLLDFPHPVMVLVCTTARAVAHDIQAQVGAFHWHQVHELNLPYVGAARIMEAMKGLQQPCTMEQAARWAQCTDGWPLYLQSLWAEGHAHIDRCPPQPQAVTTTLLADLGGVPQTMRLHLLKLAQLHDRFDAALARHVLGEEASATLDFARQRGLLVPAAAQENVTFPELQTWVDDTETHLSFASEALRVALAKQLPPPERHRLRGVLADHYQKGCPSLHLYYTKRAGLPVIEQPPEVPTAGMPLKPAPVMLLPESAPPQTLTPRHELRTANSYRVAQENGALEVLRKGSLGPAPELAIQFGALPAGKWQITARLDVFRNYTRDDPSPFALAVRLGGVVESVYAPEPLLTLPGDQCAFGQLPLHQWVRISGSSAGGAFELSVRAMDIALTISEVSWNGHNLLNPGYMQA